MRGPRIGRWRDVAGDLAHVVSKRRRAEGAPSRRRRAGAGQTGTHIRLGRSHKAARGILVMYRQWSRGLASSFSCSPLGILVVVEAGMPGVSRCRGVGPLGRGGWLTQRVMWLVELDSLGYVILVLSLKQRARTLVLHLTYP